jgi:hypothetical protein
VQRLIPGEKRNHIIGNTEIHKQIPNGISIIPLSHVKAVGISKSKGKSLPICPENLKQYDLRVLHTHLVSHIVFTDKGKKRKQPLQQTKNIFGVPQCGTPFVKNQNSFS